MTQETLDLIRKYYDQTTGEIPPGAGLVWYMSQDQLHPPMIDQPEFWGTPRGWLEGAEQTVRQLAALAHIKAGNKVLDIGCGIGGPGRLIADETSAKVTELNLSHTQLTTAKLLSHPEFSSRFAHLLQYVQANAAEIPFPADWFDCIVSVNMFYHLQNFDEAIQEFSRVLRPDGIVALDDWFLTSLTKPETKEQLQKEWSSPGGFHQYNDVINQFVEHGFAVTIELDLTEAGKNFINHEHFGNTFDKSVKPLIIENFSKLYQYPGYEPDHAETAANQLKNSVMFMGKLYRNGEAVYKQLVAKKKS